MDLISEPTTRNITRSDFEGPRDTIDAEQIVLRNSLRFTSSTPGTSSWLNQVELWFSKIERDVIARGVFTSLPDLKRKLMRYIRQYNQAPKTVKWKYFDPTKRITSQSAVTGH